MKPEEPYLNLLAAVIYRGVIDALSGRGISDIRQMKRPVGEVKRQAREWLLDENSTLKYFLAFFNIHPVYFREKMALIIKAPKPDLTKIKELLHDS